MATGNKLVREITDQFLHCKICYEPYKEPKTLTCLHTFCADCIQKHIDSDSNRSSRFLLYSRYITCPLCRSKTEIPTGGVRRLPDNFLVSSLTDVLDRRKVGKVPPCEICPGDRPRANNHASHKCLDCAKLLCKTCVNLHTTTKVTQHHSLIDIEGEKDIECKTHPEEIVRYYCEPCEECVCVVCTFQEHRDHEICSFSDGFSKYKNGLDSLLERCKDRLSDVENRLSNINSVESTLKETRENIRDLAISYIAQVRQTERQLMQRVEDEFGTKIQGYLQNKEWLQENYENLKTTCNLGEIIMNDRSVEMLLLKKELQDKLSALLEPSLPPIPENISSSIKFVPGNVKLGHISWKSEEDTDCDGGSVKHTLPEEEERPSKRQCVSRDTQTESGSTTLPPLTPEKNFEVPITNNSRGTTLINGFDQDVIAKNLDKDVSISKTDVSVNTMCSVDETKMGSVCVKCCAELKKEYGSSGSLPVVDGTPPTIQDIIITNCANGEKDRHGRRRRSLIKSRRVQTDISLSNESLDDQLNASSQESLNTSFRKLSQNSLTAVAECVITTSIGLDPIFDFEMKPPEPHKPRIFTRNKSVNTTENVKIVPDSRSVRTNTDVPEMRESTTMAFPDAISRDTQTLDKISVHKAIATDYTGQRNKRTSTPIIITMDNSTHMPPLTQESKVTWTESVQTTERSVCTEMSETVETSTETVQPTFCDQSADVKPEMNTIEINTDPVQFADSVDTSATGARPKEKKNKTKEKDKKEKTSEKKTKEKKERKEKKKYADSCVETDPVLRSDKETGTFIAQFRDSWTETFTPQLVNTGITPTRPATREVSVATNPVVLMEQATYTDVIKQQDSATETTVLICDGETLTERIGQQDAQTCVDLFLQSVETITDECYNTETGCMTDAEWFWDNEREINVVVCDVCQERRAFVDAATSPIDNKELENFDVSKSLINNETQTVKIKLYDKSNMTSCDFDDIPEQLKGLSNCDVSTSTENLPYIGLLSDMDCDELILVPEIAIDVIGSEAEYLKAYSNSFHMDMNETGAQTIISSETSNIDMLLSCDVEHAMDLFKPLACNLTTVGVNTEHTLTFEKETCTPSLHQLCKATNTIPQNEKVDKSTSTGSFVKAMQENFGQSPTVERSTKLLKQVKKEVKDVSVETDSSLMDEKMIACINKLKTVSERLNSPTTKMFAETLPWKDTNENSETSKKELDKVNDEERKKNVMDLVAKSQAMSRQKDTKTEPVRRKAQPLTTLKTKYQDKPAENEKKVSTQRRDSNGSPTSVASSKNGKETPSTQRKVPNSRRNNSAPGRIATVPNQTSLRKTSPATQPKSLANKGSTAKNEGAATLPTPAHKQNEGPDFYSTVPKTRHPKHGLASISENRHSSGSDMSSTSYRSTVSEPQNMSTSSLDKSLDFSSLKITVPPRAPSASPTPIRHPAKNDNGRVARPKTAFPPTKIEVTPSVDVTPETRVRTGSTSSDQTDNEPSQEKKGFMKKLFGSKKKKSSEKRNASPSKSPKPGRKALEAAPEPPPESPKEKPKEKPKPFVYMRSRIFSIEQKDDEKYNKPIVNKYCVNKEEEKPPVFDFAATFTKKK